MKIGDLVRLAKGHPELGLVMRIDEQYFGARQAYKIVGAKRGDCLHPRMVNTISPTRDGIRDRALVLWTEDMVWTYEESTMLEVLDESR